MYRLLGKLHIIFISANSKWIYAVFHLRAKTDFLRLVTEFRLYSVSFWFNDISSTIHPEVKEELQTQHCAGTYSIMEKQKKGYTKPNLDAVESPFLQSAPQKGNSSVKLFKFEQDPTSGDYTFFIGKNIQRAVNYP